MFGGFGECAQPDMVGARVGDIDGVVVVPKDAIAEVVARVEEKNSGENLFRNAVREGMAPSEAFAKFGVL